MAHSITVANGGSGSVAAREILAASVAPHGTAESDKILQEEDWRWGYAKHFVRNVELSVSTHQPLCRAMGKICVLGRHYAGRA